MALELKPLDDRIVVERVEAESKTAGGIVLPESAKEKPTRGVVRAVGPGRMLDSGKRGEPSVKVGDEVYYGKYAGTDVKIGLKEYVILKESDVLAIVEK